jgi:hypothetical protein
MEAARTSETLVNFYQATRLYNPEDSRLRTHRRENLKSYLVTTIDYKNTNYNNNNSRIKNINKRSNNCTNKNNNRDKNNSRNNDNNKNPSRGFTSSWWEGLVPNDPDDLTRKV